MESMSMFASKADYWEAVAKRLGQALVDVMEPLKDHDLPAHTGMDEAACQRIAHARADAARLIGG